MKILLAGASGFIGKNFILKAPQEWEITGVYRSNSAFPAFANKFDNLKIVKCNLSNLAQVESELFPLPEFFDACIFVWGNSDIGYSCREPAEDLNDNVLSLINLVSRNRFGKFIFMSSGTVYMGQNGLVEDGKLLIPSTPYGISKLASELYLRFFSEKTGQIKKYVNIRFFGAYGPMEPSRKIFTSLIKRFSIEKKNDFTLGGDGTNLIDAMYIEDAIDALKKIILSDKGNLTVDLCKGRPLTLRDLVLKVAEILNVKDPQIKYTGEPKEKITFYASPQKADKLFGFCAKVPLEEGIIKLKNHLIGANTHG